MRNPKELWKVSRQFRRMVAAFVLASAALLVYLGSHITRALSLPAEDLNAKAMARSGDQQIVISKPVIADGDVALSYLGNTNEVADLWVQNATLDTQSQRLLFPGMPAPAPGTISYTTSSNSPRPGHADDTCHTTVEVRRARKSSPIESLRLYQTDASAGRQRFRQLVLDPGSAALEIEVHTDSPNEGESNLSGCHKLLTVPGAQPMDVPPIPLHLLVHGGTVNLHFNPANPALPIWTGPGDTFEAVSLGDSALRASGLQVISTENPGHPRLDVRASRSGGEITLSRLKIGAEALKLDVGRDGEKAVVYAEGKSLYNYDLVSAIQGNPILSFVFVAILVPALWKWTRSNLFPEQEVVAVKEPESGQA